MYKMQAVGVAECRWLLWDAEARRLTDPSGERSVLPADVDVNLVAQLAARAGVEWRGDAPISQGKVLNCTELHWLAQSVCVVLPLSQWVEISPVQLSTRIEGADASWDGYCGVAAATAIAPLHEEVVYRYLLLPQLLACLPVPHACVLNGAIFSAMHFQSGDGFTPAAGVFYFGFGTLLAHCYASTGRILVPLGLHMLNNAFVLAVKT